MANVELDDITAELVGGARVWAGLPLRDRRALLEPLRGLVAEHAAEWVRVSGEIKRLDPTSPIMGEEWITGPYAVASSVDALIGTLLALERGLSPVDGFEVSPAPGGRTAVRVLPHRAWDRLLFSGYSVEVWTRPGVDAATLRERAGRALRESALAGGVRAILGAGNVTSIAPLDALDALYAHGQVVALKLHPLSDPLLPVLERVFAPLIEGGFVRILTGGADVGHALVHHPDVTSVHMTGSAATHDAVVFGDRSRAARRMPELVKPITSELGGVSPTIVLPGSWSAADLRFQAEHIAAQRLSNGGYNCIAAQVVLLSSHWPQKETFLRELERAIDRAPARDPYYPGSSERVARARARYPSARILGHAGERTLLPGVPPAVGEHALTEEFFAPVLAVTELPGSAPQFLRCAVEAANERIMGTLGANLLVEPRTQRALGPALDEAIAELRYGTVAVNAWTGMGYLTPRASWGAFPGHTVDQVESGLGVVHNALLLDDVERTVVRGPFRPMPRSFAHGQFSLAPKPLWFTSNRTAATTGRLLTYFAAEPRWTKLPRILASGVRG